MSGRRIALDFVRKDANAGRLKIVPVGLLYTAKGQIRSEVWMRFGPAIDIADWIAQHDNPDGDALTGELRRRIEALTIGYRDRREMVLVNWASEIVATQAQAPRLLGSALPPVAESFARLSLIQAGYRTLLDSHAAEISDLTERVRRYRAELRRQGIDSSEIYLPRSPFRAIFFLIRELELIVIGAPIALFGILNHLIPYLLVRRIARRMSTDKDHWATNVIYPSFIVFPFFYAIQIAIAWLMLSAFWAALYTVALPYSGFYAILYTDRAGSAWRRASTFLFLLLRPSIQTRLAHEGREILAGIQQLARHLPSDGEPAASASEATT